MPESVTIHSYTPKAKQARFHADGHKCRLFGGARGPGKSRALLEEAIAVCTIDDRTGQYRKEAKGLNALILRTSLTDLEGSIIMRFRESEWFMKGGAKFNEQKKLVTFPNGATLKFGYASNKKDLQQYLGHEYAFIGIDEAGLVKEFDSFISLLGCLRCPIKDVKCRIALTANPGGPGHNWLKAMFVSGIPAPGMEPQQYNRNDYSYIPANYLDGIYADDPDYLANLKSQSKAVQKAWIDGDWDVIAGSYFDHWNLPTMTFANGTLERQPWWKIWISIDWGFKHYCAAYWHCMDDAGNVFTFKELVFASVVPNSEHDPIKHNKGSRAVAQLIADKCKGMRIETIYLSPDAKQKRDADAHPVIAQMGEVFAANGLPYPTVATDDRAAGWLLMYQLLASGEWKISDQCNEAIAALPSLMTSEDKKDDVLKTASIADDCADSLRYGILSHLQGRKSRKPDHIAKDEFLKTQPNVQARYMADLRWQEVQEKARARVKAMGRISGQKRFRRP